MKILENKRAFRHEKFNNTFKSQFFVPKFPISVENSRKCICVSTTFSTSREYRGQQPSVAQVKKQHSCTTFKIVLHSNAKNSPETRVTLAISRISSHTPVE